MNNTNFVICKEASEDCNTKNIFDKGLNQTSHVQGVMEYGRPNWWMFCFCGFAVPFNNL